MLELAARSIGGLCSRSLRFGVGVSLEEVILRHALGLPLGDLAPRGGGVGRDDAPDPPRGRAAGGARPGRGAGRAGHRRARDLDRPRPSRPCRCPRAIATSASCSPRGETPAQVEHALRAAHERLRIDIDRARGRRAGRRARGAGLGSEAMRVLLDLDLRARPPAVARGLAGGRAAQGGARGALPRPRGRALGRRRAGVGAGRRLLGADAHRDAPGDAGGGRRAPRAPRAADLLLRALRAGEPRPHGRARWPTARSPASTSRR